MVNGEDHSQPGENVSPGEPGEAPLPDDDVTAARKRRFGTDSEEDKQMKRAFRFGLSHPKLEALKKQQRQLRFADNAEQSSTVIELRRKRFGIISEEGEKEKRLKRAERFGTPNVDLDALKLEKRKKRFNKSAVDNLVVIGQQQQTQP